MKLARAKEPFRFFSRLSLTAATGVKAHDLPELLEGIKTAPDSAIYTHTHRFIQQHQFLSVEPTNDFAVWAAGALQDDAAGERLLAVDPIRFQTIKGIRTALMQALMEHLKLHPGGRRAPEGREFHFLRSVRFSIPTTRVAFDLAEFIEGIRAASPASLYLHVFEARLRPPLGENDLSVWLKRDLGEKELADRIAQLDPYSYNHEVLKSGILLMLEQRLEALTNG